MFTVIQDGDVLEQFPTAAEAASFVRAIAEAMQADATRFERMANAVERGEHIGPVDGVTFGWSHAGSYLDLAVEQG